jgi:hypothetical protein
MKPALAGIKGAFVYEHSYYGSQVRAWVWVALWTTVAALVIFGGVYVIISAVRSAGAASCRTFASQSGYHSHYKIQHWADGGACFVTLPNGHALPQKMVVAYLKANK